MDNQVAAETLERTALANSSDPATDDLTVPLAIELAQMMIERRKMIAALQKIARWFGEFPDTGRTWGDGEPMSYAAAFGSNGERDFMRGVARNALPEAANPPQPTHA